MPDDADVSKARSAFSAPKTQARNKGNLTAPAPVQSVDEIPWGRVVAADAALSVRPRNAEQAHQRSRAEPGFERLCRVVRCSGFVDRRLMPSAGVVEERGGRIEAQAIGGIGGCPAKAQYRLHPRE